MMDRLSLDFVQTSDQRHSARVVMVIAGVLAISTVAFWHAQLQNKVHGLESQAARMERGARAVAPEAAGIDEAVAQEIQRANEVLDQLTLPWDRLFRAVEDVAIGSVTLLGVAPDARSGTVQITAESADSEAMFDYVKRLEQQPELANVYLIEHQRDKRAGSRPLRFVITASWLATQNKR